MLTIHSTPIGHLEKKGFPRTLQGAWEVKNEKRLMPPKSEFSLEKKRRNRTAKQRKSKWNPRLSEGFCIKILQKYSFRKTRNKAKNWKYSQGQRTGVKVERRLKIKSSCVYLRKLCKVLRRQASWLKVTTGKAQKPCKKHCQWTMRSLTYKNMETLH